MSWEKNILEFYPHRTSQKQEKQRKAISNWLDNFKQGDEEMSVICTKWDYKELDVTKSNNKQEVVENHDQWNPGCILHRRE